MPLPPASAVFKSQGLAIVPAPEAEPVGDAYHTPEGVGVGGGVTTTFCVNEADTDALAVRVTLHVGEEPLHAPDQPLKVEPEAAAAVNVTTVPLVDV